MRVIRLNGGLGNQLFQVCCAVFTERHLGERVLVDVSQYVSYRNRPTHRDLGVDPSLFGLRTTQLWKLMRRTPASIRSRYVHSFDDSSWWDVETVSKKHIFLEGYYQDRALVDRVSADVMPTLKTIVGPAPSEAPFVAVHIRLGDYLDPDVRVTLGVIDPVWSLEQGRDLADSCGVDRRVIFTDSPTDLHRLVDRKSLAGFSIDESGSAVEVLGKMSRASGFVMANSSLSWWGARLIGWSSQGSVPIVQPTPWTSVGLSLDTTLIVAHHDLRQRRVLA